MPVEQAGGFPAELASFVMEAATGDQAPLHTKIVDVEALDIEGELFPVELAPELEKHEVSIPWVAAVAVPVSPPAAPVPIQLLPEVEGAGSETLQPVTVLASTPVLAPAPEPAPAPVALTMPVEAGVRPAESDPDPEEQFAHVETPPLDERIDVSPPPAGVPPGNTDAPELSRGENTKNAGTRSPGPAPETSSRDAAPKPELAFGLRLTSVEPPANPKSAVASRLSATREAARQSAGTVRRIEVAPETLPRQQTNAPMNAAPDVMPAPVPELTVHDTGAGADSRLAPVPRPASPAVAVKGGVVPPERAIMPRADTPSVEAPAPPRNNLTSPEGGPPPGLAGRVKHSADAELNRPASPQQPLPAVAGPPDHIHSSIVSGTEKQVPARPQSAWPAAEAASIADVPSRVSSPTREISLSLGGRGQGGVDVRVVERSGKVHVAVRTPDTQLASSLRGQLGELVTRMEQRGYQTETLLPVADSLPSSPPFREASGTPGHSSQHAPGHHGSGGGAPQQREQRQQHGSAWLQELERTSKDDHEASKEQDQWNPLWRS